MSGVSPLAGLGVRSSDVLNPADGLIVWNALPADYLCHMRRAQSYFMSKGVQPA